MKSDIIQIDNTENGFLEAKEQTAKSAAFRGLDRKSSILLQLMTEEMLSMISIVTGELTASFWVERVGLQYELHLTVQTEMDRKKKRQLKASSSARKNTGSFQEKLRSAFERALASDTDDICFEMPESADRLASGEWDGYERSVLVRLADNLRIAIHGREVRMTVRKDFSAAS